jgi:aminoglycoside 6'-N-acetyltransferase I
MVLVRKMTHTDIPSWLDMRIELWPHCPLDEHTQEIHEQLDSPETLQCFIILINNQPIGFLEAAIHQNAHQRFGFSGYIEGWFVKNHYRMSGYGKRLVEAAEMWAVEKGCELMASDTEDFNMGSIAAHTKMGYLEQFRANGEVKYLKSLR